MRQRPSFPPRLILPILALLLLSFLTGCPSGTEEPGRPPAQDPVRGGTLVIGSTTDVDSWNECLARRSVSLSFIRRIFLRLAQENGDGQEGPQTYSPLLAESWNAGADGLSWTFTLREAQWSDGTPIRADDVRFTWEAQTSDLVPWISADSKSHITDVEVIDDRTVTFRFDGRYPYQFADAVEGGILPRHVFGEIPFEQWKDHDWSTISIGSGPYILESHTPEQEAVLVRNPNYFREGHPLLDRVVIRIVPDIANLLTQLRSGDIHYVEGITPRNADRLEADPKISLGAFDYDYDYLGWNGSRAPFDDPEVRRAITQAIDRNALVEDMLFGYGALSKGPVLSSWWGSSKEITPWPYDPDAARTVLAAHGYDDDNPLKLELMTNASNRLRGEMLVKIQEQLGRIGMEVTVRPVDMGSMMQNVFSGNYDGYLAGWSFVGKVDLTPLFGSEFVPPRGNNVVQYKNPALDDLLRQLDESAAWEDMRPILGEIQKTIHQDQPYTFLYERKRIAAWSSAIGGLEIAIASDPLARLEQFWIRN